MARMRRLPVSLVVCTGVLLLLFNGTTADTIQTSSTLLNKLRSAGEYTESHTNNTLLNKVSSVEENVGTVSPLPDNRKTDELSVEELETLERKEISVAKSSTAAENVPSVVSDGSEVQGIRPPVHHDGSLTLSPANNASILEEPLYDKTGKSSKSSAESSSRLTRTNDLATVTTKPAREESPVINGDQEEVPSKQQEVKDITVAEATTTKLNSQDQAHEEGDARRSTERNLPLKLESSTLSSTTWERSESSKKEENVRKEIEVATPTVRSLAESTREGKEVNGLESKNLEVQDLGKVEKKEDDFTISLINDTNVNYSPRVNSSIGNGSSIGNNTNSISGESGVSHGRVGPKEEVEVVRNVTQSPVQKIVAAEQTSEQLRATSEVNESGSNNEASSKQRIAEVNTEKLEEKVEDSKSGREVAEKKEDEQSKQAGIGSNRGNQEDGQTISTPENSQSPIPRGRTIAFSGINEFPSLESKTTAVSKETDLLSSKKNTTTDKALEQKPYPYFKSIVTPSTLKVSNREEKPLEAENLTTEESSPFENTIVRGDTEKKIIVTEPSVVIENSIQQFKLDHTEKSANDSSSNTTSSQASVSSTTQLLPEVRPTNKTLIDGGSTEPKGIGDSPKEKSTSASGNDIPQGSEVITTKDGGFDVTGNGITEVTVKPEIPNKGSSYETPFTMTNGTTEVPLITSTVSQVIPVKIASNTEMQTDAEESLLIRSTLNASEISTEYPLTKTTLKIQTMSATTLPANSTSLEVENTKLLPTTDVNSSEHVISTIKSIPESIDGGDTNGTNEIPTGMDSVTMSNKEIPLPTTTAVEYEFVGLTEATTIIPQNVTEGIVKENSTEMPVTGLLRTTVPGVQDMSTKEYTMEDAPSTMAPDATESLASSEIEHTLTYDMTNVVTTEETPLASTIPQPTTGSKLEDSTALPTYENQTEKTVVTKDEQEFKMTTLTQSFITTTEREIIDTAVGTESPVNSPEATVNMTEVPNTKTGTTWILDGTTVMTTDEKEASTPSTPTPSPPTLPPSVFGPSTSADVTTQKTTDSIQNLSPEEITSLVQIVIQGSFHEVCPQLDALRAVLAELLRSEMNNPVHAKQIIIHQSPCLEKPSSAPTPTDTPLMSILVYVVNEEGKFDSAMTNMLPSLYNSTSMSFPVTIHSFLLVQEKDSGNAIAVVVVSSVAFICLVLLAGLLFIMRKRQTRFNYGERCRPVSLDAFSLDSVSAYNSVRRKGAVRSSKRSYGNPTFEDSPASAATQRNSNGMKQSAIPSHPLNFASLSAFCNDVNTINEEFAGIPQVSAKIDELPPGAEVKNRYANVIPLPETRVPLQKINNDPLTEYINASYVRGPRNATRYYIACQAPMETTVNDFWRMIWEQQSKVVIMLTDLVENDVEKCTEYIPPSEVTDCHRLYGDFQVTLKKRETKEKYAISTLHLKNLENNTFREVYHIWYLWPVNGVQSDGAGLIAVILEARALQRAGPGPIVVHCSPGTGRTGTLIALDLGIRQYEITRTVDVPRVVYTIRRDRAGAVQTKEQYAFIYKALNLYATKLAGGGGLEST